MPSTIRILGIHAQRCPISSMHVGYGSVLLIPIDSDAYVSSLVLFIVLYYTNSRYVHCGAVAYNVKLLRYGCC